MCACVCPRAHVRVLQLSDLSQVGCKCTRCQLSALLTALSGQHNNQKCCAQHSAESGSQVSARSLFRGPAAQWSLQSAAKGAETASHTHLRLARKTRYGEKPGAGKELGERTGRGNLEPGHKVLTTEQGLRSGAARVLGALQAAFLVSSPSLRVPRTPRLPGSPPSCRPHRGLSEC